MRISKKLFEAASFRLPWESPEHLTDIAGELDAAQIAFETFMFDASSGASHNQRDETRARIKAAIAAVDACRAKPKKAKKS